MDRQICNSALQVINMDGVEIAPRLLELTLEAVNSLLHSFLNERTGCGVEAAEEDPVLERGRYKTVA